jgi:serine/threonine protein kinase/tetratricopeptide (TPR) repeat protein
MPLECAVCHTSNPPGSLACLKCSNPIDSVSPFDQSTAADVPRDAEGPGGSLSPGTILAERYEVLKMLGEGGMGAVYKAMDRELDRIVALKVIRSELADKPDILQRFKQELILARLVTHRNVIRIFDLGVSGNIKFITMDFVEGRDLKSVLTEQRKLSAGKACDIIRQICLGLEAAHTEGVVHRDLKPQNIMLDSQGRVYLMDFGLARSMELVGMTRTGAMLGTPAYMSPEQAKGEKVDARTDLFSLGIIFYELVTGTLPYQAESMMATLIKRAKEPPVPPNQVDPSVPPAVNDAIMKCLQIKLERRYQTAGEILADLGFNSALQTSTVQSSVIASKSVFDVASNLTPGSQFGPRYRIESLLGEGGMGKVYKAYDSDVGRMVALKLVKPELARNPASMERLKQELLLASQVSHKNILRIHDLGDVGGLKFISMAYVDGKDLHNLIAAEGKLPIDRAVAITRLLCLALEAAHNEGVVHRDLKPQNVLMDSNGQVFVSDFGLAKSLEGPSTMMTNASEVLGTPRYMSPEQAESKSADNRSDLYALGLILYEMVTGDLPFGSDSIMQTMYQRVTQDPKSPQLLNPDVPDYLSQIILRCLKRDPSQRYQHARDILVDLDRGAGPPHEIASPIGGPPTSLPPDASFTTSGRMWKPALVWPIAGVLALLALAFAVPRSRQAILGLTQGSAKSTARISRNAKFVAILPFRTLGEDASLDDAANGIVEALSAKLFQLKDIHLASASEAAKVNPKDPMAQIAQSLGVKLLVRGSVQGSGDRMAIVVSLDEAATGRRIWSQEFSGLKQDLLTLQDQIYAGLLSAFDLKLSNEELAKGTGHFSENVGAYELYLKGRSLLRSGQRDEKTLQQALALFNGATLKDPGFTLAYTGIADTCRYLYALKKDGTWAVKALGAANRAQELNDNLPEVHFALGSLYTATGKSAEAVSELKRALELAPNSDDGYLRLGRAYLNMGQKPEALSAFQHAIDANPYYWSNYNMLGVAYSQFGDNGKASQAFQKVTELDPKNPNGWINLGTLALHEGNWNLAIPAFRKALELKPSVESYSNLGTSYFFLGNYEQARANFAKALEMSPKEADLVGFLADCYRRLGQAPKARATYEQAISMTYQSLQTNPRDAKALDELGVYYAKEGDTTKGLQFIQRARAIDPENVDFLYDEAAINTLANRMPEALKSLEQALTKGYSPRAVLSDPELTPLRQQPEFQTMIQKFQPK